MDVLGKAREDVGGTALRLNPGCLFPTSNSAGILVAANGELQLACRFSQVPQMFTSITATLSTLRQRWIGRGS